MELVKAIKEAIIYLDKESFAGLKINYHLSSNQSLLKIKKNNNQVDICYGSLSNLFRGLTIVKEQGSKNYSIELLQRRKTSGLMLDCSRNGVLKNDKVKELILISALMGHNRLLLYTEDTYKLDKYQYFGYLRGGYSKEDIKEFVEYGESFGVELVPCIQSLGHLYQALKWGPMAELRDGMDTLLVDSEKVYQFIEEAIKFSRECFHSKDIHIGMDESTEMGLKRHFLLHGYQDRVEMFSRHLTRVSQICQKYDFEPMIWSDMYFRLNNKDEDYYRETPLPESTLKLIPQDINLVYWDYYHEDIETYQRMIKYHKQTKNKIIFAGGSWRWKGYAPSIEKSMEYTDKALKACNEENVVDVFITAWGDDGSECSFFSVLPVLAETSVLNYGDYNEGEINNLLKAVTGDSLSDFLAMDLPDEPAKKTLAPMYNPSKYFLYQDLLLGQFDSQVKDEYAKNYREFVQILKEKANCSIKYNYIYYNLYCLCDLLSLKVDLGVKLRTAYKNKDNKQLRELTKTIDALLPKLEEFRLSVEKRWMKECRPFGFEVLDGRIGFLNNRIISAKKRVLEYLDGKISVIEELEQEILPYDGYDYEIQSNNWLRNVSTSY